FANEQNRSDDNDAKDIAFKLLLRPLWKHEKWGSLELGYSRQDGVHGESGHGFRLAAGVVPSTDGLSLQETAANRQYAWAWYRPGGPVKGWWLRGEWAAIRERSQPGMGAFISVQLEPAVYSRSGWYFSTGYKLADSIWGECLANG